MGWNAAFVSWCYYEAEGQMISDREGKQRPANPEDRWLGCHLSVEGLVTRLREAQNSGGDQLFFEAGSSYVPVPGDLVFLSEGGRFSRVAIVHHVNGRVLHAIEGDSDQEMLGRTQVESWSRHMKTSYAFGRIPEPI